MRKEVQSIGIVRERGQVTIPTKIRKAAEWTEPEQAVIFVLMKDGELRLRPYAPAHTNDWSAIWKGVHLARSQKGKRGNLSRFIASDRLRRS